jgi:hypothetical protein
MNQDVNHDMNVHQIPKDGMMCLVTYEDITKENYVEYQVYPSMKWKPALFEQCVVEQMLNDMFQQYIDRVKKTDCQAELRRLLAKGPPVYISDDHGLPLDEGEEYVIRLWFSSDNSIRSAKLNGSKEGDERQLLWDELNQFIVVDGKEPGDEDDNDETIKHP